MRLNLKGLAIKALILQLAYLSVLGLVASACTQQHLNCQNSSAKLLQLAKLEIGPAPFISVRVMTIESNANDGTYNQPLSCTARIKYTYDIFTTPSFLAKVTFSFNHQAQMDDFIFINIKPALQQWLAKLPTLTALQKTNSGNLSVLQLPQKEQRQTHNQIQSLAFNNQLITLPNGKNYSTITIDKKFTTAEQDFFLISAYYNNAHDWHSDHNYLLSINAQGNVFVSQAFSYQDGSMQQQDQRIIFKGLNRWPFAESNDYPLYGYQGKQILLLQPSQPLSYYTKKFAHANASIILQQIKADGCLNGDQFYASTICTSQVYTYCFKFAALAKSFKNKDYRLLATLCKPNQY